MDFLTQWLIHIECIMNELFFSSEEDYSKEMNSNSFYLEAYDLLSR